MLPRLAKSLAVKTSTSRSVQPLAEYLGEQISTFWHKPRVDAPRPAVAKPRTGCNEAVNSTCSPWRSNRKFECAFREPLIIVAWLFLAYNSRGGMLVSNTLGSLCEKYSLLKTAKHEWDTKSELEKRLSTAEKINDGSDVDSLN